MKLVNDSGSHEIEIDDHEAGEINTYRAHGYATKDEHAEAAKAQAAHDKHMASMFDEPGTSAIRPVTPKASK